MCTASPPQRVKALGVAAAGNSCDLRVGVRCGRSWARQQPLAKKEGRSFRHPHILNPHIISKPLGQLQARQPFLTRSQLLKPQNPLPYLNLAEALSSQLICCQRMSSRAETPFLTLNLARASDGRQEGSGNKAAAHGQTRGPGARRKCGRHGGGVALRSRKQ